MRYTKGDEEEADSLVTEAFTRLTDLRGEDLTKAKPSTWIWGVTRNLCIDYARRKRRDAIRLPEYQARLERDLHKRRDGAEMRIVCADLEEAIARLPTKQRIAITEDLNSKGRSMEEVARDLGWNVLAYRTNLTYARRRLKEILTRKGY